MTEGENFVTLWQTSASLGEFCRKTKMTAQNACNKAKRLRDLGVPLKSYKAVLIRPSINWREIAELKALALSLIEPSRHPAAQERP